MSEPEQLNYLWDDEPRPVHTEFILRMASNLRKNYLRQQKTTEVTLGERVTELENQMRDVQKQLQTKKLPAYNKGDYVYEMHREELEKNYMGQVVAIDMTQKKPIAYGSSVAEAYLKAKILEPEQSQYYFRRIGKPYVEKL